MLVDDREMNDVSTKITSTRPVYFSMFVIRFCPQTQRPGPSPPTTVHRPAPFSWREESVQTTLYIQLVRLFRG